MAVIDFTTFGFYLNGAIDDGHTGKITTSDVHDALQRGENILTWLSTQLPEAHFDPTILNEQSIRHINASFLDLSLAVNERRKLMVDNDGLCLLLAYCLESIQRETPR